MKYFYRLYIYIYKTNCFAQKQNYTSTPTWTRLYELRSTETNLNGAEILGNFLKKKYTLAGTTGTILIAMHLLLRQVSESVVDLQRTLITYLKDSRIHLQVDNILS